MFSNSSLFTTQGYMTDNYSSGRNIFSNNGKKMVDFLSEGVYNIHYNVKRLTPYTGKTMRNFIIAAAAALTMAGCTLPEEGTIVYDQGYPSAPEVDTGSTGGGIGTGADGGDSGSGTGDDGGDDGSTTGTGDGDGTGDGSGDGTDGSTGDGTGTGTGDGSGTGDGTGDGRRATRGGGACSALTIPRPRAALAAAPRHHLCAGGLPGSELR